MAKPPMHPYGLNPLRRLRECLGKRGREHPITQLELGEILGLSPNSIRAYEAGQRRLPDAIILQAITLVGADWDSAKKRWIRFSSNPPEPFKWEHYEQFRKRTMQRPTKADKLAKELLARMYLLFDLVPDSHWLDLYFRFRLFGMNCHRDFEMDKLLELYSFCRDHFIGKPEGKDFERFYQETLGENRLQKKGWQAAELTMGAKPQRGLACAAVSRK